MAGLCILTRVAADRVDELRESLEALPADDASPFAAVPGTHFLRWVVVPALPSRDRTPLGPHTARLMFAAEHDAPSAIDYLARVLEHSGDPARAAWSHCRGFPEDGEGMVPWLLAHELPAGFSVTAYPGAGADEVRRALDLRERIGAFAVEAQALEPAELQRRWLERFGAQEMA